MKKWKDVWIHCGVGVGLPPIGDYVDTLRRDPVGIPSSPIPSALSWNSLNDSKTYFKRKREISNKYSIIYFQPGHVLPESRTHVVVRNAPQVRALQVPAPILCKLICAALFFLLFIFYLWIPLLISTWPGSTWKIVVSRSSPQEDGPWPCGVAPLPCSRPPCPSSVRT